MKRSVWELAFSCNGEEETLVLEAEGRRVLCATWQEGMLSFALFYDHTSEPLRLSAPAGVGECVLLRAYPERLELWINGILQDEEWPYGLCPLEEASPVVCPADFRQGYREVLLEEEPSVLGQFSPAEGWRPEERVYVGDCMPYTAGGRYHVLYLKDRRHHKSKWGKGAHQWSHISTEDGKAWQVHPMAVAIDGPEEGSICTGSYIEKDGKAYLFYSVRTCDGSPAPLRRSVSEDGYHFTKDPTFGFCLSEKYVGASARDPKVILAEDGSYHMLVTTSLSESGCGCLAHLVSEDLFTWKELPEPIFVAKKEEWEPECSDYFRIGPYYYLVFSLHGVGTYRISRRPFDGFALPKDPVIPCHSVPKAAFLGDDLVFAGFLPLAEEGGYAGTMTFLGARPGPDGELVYYPVKL